MLNDRRHYHLLMLTKHFFVIVRCGNCQASCVGDRWPWKSHRGWSRAQRRHLVTTQMTPASTRALLQREGEQKLFSSPALISWTNHGNSVNKNLMESQDVPFKMFYYIFVGKYFHYFLKKINQSTGLRSWCLDEYWTQHTFFILNLSLVSVPTCS